MIVSLICIIIPACLGCESSKQYGVGVRGEIPGFQDPESLIKSYNRAFTMGHVPPYQAAGEDYFFVRLFPDMTAYYTSRDAPSRSDLELLAAGSGSMFDLLMSIRKAWGRAVATRAYESWVLFSSPADDRIDLSTLQIIDGENAIAHGHVTSAVSDFASEMKRHDLTYVMVKTEGGWKIVFHDLHKSFVGTIAVYICKQSAGCIKDLAAEVDQGQYAFAEQVEAVFKEQCLSKSKNEDMDVWMRSRMLEE
ncbi:MAG: hypothetical protein P8M22_00600 [Phycisphaerales bacterium]|nr:hypothetical protein [Phycisphaerales bacterium]